MSDRKASGSSGNFSKFGWGALLVFIGGYMITAGLSMVSRVDSNPVLNVASIIGGLSVFVFGVMVIFKKPKPDSEQESIRPLV